MIKLIFGAALCLLLMAIGYHYAGSSGMQSWLRDREAQPKLIQFDNDVRNAANAVVAASAANVAANPDTPRVNKLGMRKCRKGDSMIYTDDLCPPGYKELDLKNGTVTVVPKDSNSN